MGGTVPAGFTAADIVAGAVDEWHRVTGWNPFLAAAGTTTLQYDPTNAYTLRTAAFFTVTGVTVNGVAKAEETDYWPIPYDGQTLGVPIIGLRFRDPLTGEPRTISVTGRRGYDDTIPLDAWMAVLNLAIAKTLTYSAGTVGPVSELEQGLVKVKYQSGEGQSTISNLTAQFKKTARRYKRADVF